MFLLLPFFRRINLVFFYIKVDQNVFGDGRALPGPEKESASLNFVICKILLMPPYRFVVDGCDAEYVHFVMLF